MIMLAWDKTARCHPGIALVFGTGLIGGAVVQSMVGAMDSIRVRRFDWSWSDPSAAELLDIEATAIAFLTSEQSASFTVLWAAGNSGFSTDTEGMLAEFKALERVLELTRKIGATISSERRHFVHISSAGGLFEGQVCCGTSSQPAPLRPYGHGKLAQEDLIRSDERLGVRRILRPSSVYGYAPAARRGLFSMFASTALNSRTVTIMGALTTQRDYVYAADIGRFVAELVLSHSVGSSNDLVETSTLASGRPAMIYEVINLLEAQLGRPLFKKIDPRPENARNNTFLQSALPHDFRPTELSQGIALIVAAVAHDRFRGRPL